MRVMFDIDGVGFNFVDSCHRYLEHIGQGHLWKSGPTPNPYWDWYKDWGWTTEQFIEFCNAGADAGFIFAGPVNDGYVEMIATCGRLGHEIIIATDRPFGSTPEVSQKLTVDWLEQHGIEYDELHFTADKTTSNCHMTIDDKLSNYDALVAAGVKAYLLNRPWNQVEGGDARNRIDSLEEFEDAIRQAHVEKTLQLQF
jgi:hypothetical protein